MSISRNEKSKESFLGEAIDDAISSVQSKSLASFCKLE